MAKSHAHATELRRVLRLFALFGHPVRVVIFQRLARAPQTAGELAGGLPISRTAVVQHLKLLESGRLVNAASHGRRRVYGVQSEGLAPLAHWIAQHSVPRAGSTQPLAMRPTLMRRTSPVNTVKVSAYAVTASRDRQCAQMPVRSSRSDGKAPGTPRSTPSIRARSSRPWRCFRRRPRRTR
jgi:DNA-binding transcriptional ArsR family regulator